MNIFFVFQLDVQIFFNDDFFLLFQCAIVFGKLETDSNCYNNQNCYKKVLANVFLFVVKVNVSDIVDLEVVT